MAYVPSLRKVLILGASLAACGLSACEGPRRDGQDFQRLAAQIQAIEVEDTTSADDRIGTHGPDQTAQVISESNAQNTKSGNGLSVVVNTARDMAVGNGGLFTQSNKLRVEVVEPLDLDRYAAPENTPNNFSGNNLASTYDTATQAMAFATQNLSAEPLDPEVKPASQTVNKGRTVQLGSFSTREGAENAWEALKTKHPEMARFNPQMQNIRTNGGKVLVRLKVGPVFTDAEAQVMCEKLDVKDTWCTRAG